MSEARVIPTSNQTSDVVRIVAEELGTTFLIVSCALNPIYEWRAVRAVGQDDVRRIQNAAAQHGWSRPKSSVRSCEPPNESVDVLDPWADERGAA